MVTWLDRLARSNRFSICLRQSRTKARASSHTRTSEDRERAKAKGVKLGRKLKLSEHQKREAINVVTGAMRRLPILAA